MLSAYFKLEGLGFGVNEGDEDTRAKSEEQWEDYINGPDRPVPYNANGTYEMNGKTYNCGKQLADSIEGDTSFDFKDALLWIVKDKSIAAAEAINEAFTDGEQAKDMLMSIMAARSPDDRTEVARVYEELYGGGPEGTYSSKHGGMKIDALRNAISENLDGEFADVARDMFQDEDEKRADYCFLAMHGSAKDEILEANGVTLDRSKQDNVAETIFRSGMIGGFGTDEARLARNVLFSSRRQLSAMGEAYQVKYGNLEGMDRPTHLGAGAPALMQDIYSEVGGDFRALLMYKFRRARSGLMHVPRKKLLRCDDMPSDFPIDAIAKYDII